MVGALLCCAGGGGAHPSTSLTEIHFDGFYPAKVFVNLVSCVLHTSWTVIHYFSLILCSARSQGSLISTSQQSPELAVAASWRCVQDPQVVTRPVCCYPFPPPQSHTGSAAPNGTNFRFHLRPSRPPRLSQREMNESLTALLSLTEPHCNLTF